MTPALETQSLTKRYGKRTALLDCTLTVPAGHVVGLVGPNGAGKSTLLNLAAGLLEASSGTIEVLGGRPAHDSAHLARVGFVAQDTPTYAAFSIADHLKLGRKTNPAWDDDFAHRRIESLGLRLDQKAGRLSGGQRAQIGLTMALAKRPDLLILDEPVAALDPLARREFLDGLAEFVDSSNSERRVSVLISSHLVTDLQHVCDYLVVLVASQVRAAGPIAELLGGSRVTQLEDLVLQHLRSDKEAQR